jgi:hypothetical protein
MDVIVQATIEFIQELSDTVLDIYLTGERPRQGVCVVSVLVWLLSKSLPLTEAYLRSWSSCPRVHLAEGESQDTQTLQLSCWLLTYADRVLHALTHVKDAYRIRADEFLVRSLVAEFVSEQNSKGLTVPTDTAIEMYLRFWSHRPSSLRVQENLRKLTHHRNTRRKFGVLLRAEWMLQFSVIKVARDLEFDEIRSRAISVNKCPTRSAQCDGLTDCERDQKFRVECSTHKSRSELLFWFTSLPFPGTDLPELDALCCRRCYGRTAACFHQHGRNFGQFNQAQW